MAQNGESVHDILSTPLPHEQSFKEWEDAMLNKLYDATSDASPLSTSGLNMPNEDAHGILWACRNELLQIDQVRIRMLSTLSNQGLSECKIRKVQKFFQVLLLYRCGLSHQRADPLFVLLAIGSKHCRASTKL